MILLLNICKVNRFIHKILKRFLFCFGSYDEGKKKDREVSVLLDHMNFQKIKIDFFYKIILVKTRFAVALKF